jgi:hypothetical protein
MARTPTLHQAGNKDFDPANYEFLGLDDLGADEENKSVSSCAHCGRTIRYVAELKNLTTGEEILVGETCLDSRFGISRTEFDALRKEGRLNSQRKTIFERIESFKIEFPIVIELIARREDHYILADLAGKFERDANLSTKQLDLVAKLFVQVDEQKARIVERDAKNAELIAQGVKCPEGRLVIEGTILSVKSYENDYGFQMKMLVQDNSGFKVWSSVPGYRDVVAGMKIRFNAQITPSNDDPLFGFAKRPTKCTVLIEGEWM